MAVWPVSEGERGVHGRVRVIGIVCMDAVGVRVVCIVGVRVLGIVGMGRIGVFHFIVEGLVGFRPTAGQQRPYPCKTC
jgi:hypothetical protein